MQGEGQLDRSFGPQKGLRLEDSRCRCAIPAGLWERPLQMRHPSPQSARAPRPRRRTQRSAVCDQRDALAVTRGTCWS